MTEVEKEKEIGKSKIGLVISGVLIVILVISNVWSYTNLQNQINTLNDDKINLQTQVNSLTTENNRLKTWLDGNKTLLQTTISERNQLQTWLDGNKTLLQTTISERNQLQTWLIGNVTNYVSQIQSLNSQIATLNSQIHSLNAQITSLQNEIDSLNSEYNNYVANHHYTDEEYHACMSEPRFSFYYVEPSEQKLGVYNLRDELYGLECLHPYQEDVFDCSEMSAHLEWYLENEGWHAIIILGDTPWDSGYHAWLLVETSTDHYMPVESTTIEIVWWENPYFDNYFIYDYTFETIQEAIAHNESEFDWWKSP